MRCAVVSEITLDQDRLCGWGESGHVGDGMSTRTPDAPALQGEMAKKRRANICARTENEDFSVDGYHGIASRFVMKSEPSRYERGMSAIE